jgi:hypothetical protein
VNSGISRHSALLAGVSLLAIALDTGAALAAGASPAAQSRPAPAARPAASKQANPATPLPFDTAKIETLTGASGAAFPDEQVFKISVPRADILVQVDGVPIPSGMGLASWVGFTPAGSGALMAMGDLALFEDEVNPVLDEALAGGLEATALHNHFFFDQPRVFYLHISGHGRLENLATAVGRCLSKVKAVRAADSFPAGSFGIGPAPPAGDLEPEQIDSILKLHGEVRGGVYKVVLGRRARMHGVQAGPALGVSTWAAFYGGAADAVVDGDFAMLEAELQPVLKALRRGGVRIVAIHNHMTGETPRYVFLHYWGRGPAAELARALRAAFDRLAP